MMIRTRPRDREGERILQVYETRKREYYVYWKKTPGKHGRRSLGRIEDVRNLLELYLRARCKKVIIETLRLVGRHNLSEFLLMHDSGTLEQFRKQLRDEYIQVLDRQLERMRSNDGEHFGDGIKPCTQDINR